MGNRPQAQTVLGTSNIVDGLPDLSPDGQWLLYRSNESGENQLYVRPYPDVRSGKWQITQGGGTQPLWSNRSDELFYWINNSFYAVPVTTEPEFRPGTAQELFTGPFTVSNNVRHFDQDPNDPDRFLMLQELDRKMTSHLIYVDNWIELIRDKTNP